MYLCSVIVALFTVKNFFASLMEVCLSVWFPSCQSCQSCSFSFPLEQYWFNLKGKEEAQSCQVFTFQWCDPLLTNNPMKCSIFFQSLCLSQDQRAGPLPHLWYSSLSYRFNNSTSPCGSPLTSWSVIFKLSIKLDSLSSNWHLSCLASFPTFAAFSDYRCHLDLCSITESR